MNLISSLAWRFFPVYCKLIQNFYTLARLQGQQESMARDSVVYARGNPLPWLTYPAIEYLGQFDFRRQQVFEYGSGNSSRYWAQRARRVVSVEHDRHWFELVKSTLKDNQEIYLQSEKDGYVQTLPAQGQAFEIIVIDGKWRYACAQIAPAFLAPGGLIIFDNSEWYPNATALLRQQGFYQVDFSGFGPINNYCWTTSIFFTSLTQDQNTYKNPCPVGGIRQLAEDDQ